MRPIAFEKLSGAGNDFVLLDGRRAPRLGAVLARRLCDRKEGIGADGLLQVTPRAGGPHRVVYLNADGSQAFCGNGTRCAAWWLHLAGLGPRLRLETEEGEVQAIVVRRGRVRVGMPAGAKLRLGRELVLRGKSWTVHSVDTGVPHAVVEVRGLGFFPISEYGPPIRRHRAFGAAGANVNFIERVGPNAARARTYERGVEAETLACGTGAVAAALVLEALGRTCLPATIRTRGGDLVVSRENSQLWLEGPARVTFRGEINL